MKNLFLTTAIAATFVVAQPALAHEGEEHTQGKEMQMEHAAHADEAVSKATNADQALSEIQGAMKEIGGMIKEGRLDEIHEVSERASTAIETLKEKSALEGDKKTRLDASLKQLSTQLGKLHTVSDAKDAEKTTAEFKKTEGALKLVESALK